MNGVQIVSVDGDKPVGSEHSHAKLSHPFVFCHSPNGVNSHLQLPQSPDEELDEELDEFEVEDELENELDELELLM